MSDVRKNYILRQACEVSGVGEPQSRGDVAMALKQAIPILKSKEFPPHSNIEDMQRLLDEEFALDLLLEQDVKERRDGFRIV